MAQPVFRNSANGTGTSVSSLALTYASLVNSLLVVGVEINDGTFHVSAITDSAGNDGSGNPINTWRLIDSNDFNSTRLEVWACRPAVAITALNIVLGGSQSVAGIVAEYTNVSNYSISSKQQCASAQNPNPAVNIQLKISQTPPQAAAIMLGFFGLLGVNFASTPSGTSRAQLNDSSPVPNISLVDVSTTDANSQLTCTKTISQLATAGNVSASSLQAISVLVSSGLVLSTPPGFADLPETVLSAGKPAIGMHVAKISDNAAFGMVRLEMFVGTYSDGDTVDIPTSPVDGYVYSRDELIYGWGLFSTANKDTGWITGPDSLWYALWDVDQATGKVTSKEYYRRSSSNSPQGAVSSDGILLVYTFAQRLKNSLVLSAQPYFTDHPPADFYEDRAYNQTLARDVNRSAKYGVVSTEVIYMGEFVNGGVVPGPVSPADGYAYDKPTEVSFAFSWRWTTDGSAFTQPPMTEGQLGPLHAAVSHDGTVAMSVEMVTESGSLDTLTTWGRIAVFALCERKALTAYLTVNGNVTSAPQDVTIVTGIDPGIVLGDFMSFEQVNLPFPIDYQVITYWFADASHAQLGDSFTQGTNRPPLYKDIPAGTVYIHIEDNTFSGITIKHFRYNQRSPVANQFAELSTDIFDPGNPLRAVDLGQVQLNAAEAAATPEFSRPVVFKNGDIVPLLTSPVDGYHYSRSELSYVWEFSDTTPHEAGGTHQRTPLFFAHVDQDTGVVTIGVWRLAEGGPYVAPEIDGGRITVTVMAKRNTIGVAPAAATPNAPADSGSAITDGGGWQINGV